jgi:cell division transport system permease protein
MRRSRLPFVFLLGAVLGLGGESLLLLERQVVSFAAKLGDDFRVVLFMKADAPESKRDLIEEKLRALPGVSEVDFVSRGQALARLRLEEPELAEAAGLLSDNPLRSAFEVKLNEEGLSSLSQWLVQGQAVEDWADVRYKAQEAETAAQAVFYARFLELVLSALACLVSVMVFIGLWFFLRGRRWPLRVGSSAVMGACAGVAAAVLLALPLRVASPFWNWPGVWAQALLILSASVSGWMFGGPSE